MNDTEWLDRLCALSGPSGFEHVVCRAAAELLAPLVDEVATDRMGNLIGIRRSRMAGAKTLVLDAHLDEIGLIVTGVEEGFLRFSTLGGVDPRMLPDREVWVLGTAPLAGVITCLPPHIQQPKDYDKSIPIKELRIDVGLSQEAAQQRIPIGTAVTYRGGCSSLGEQLLCGKSLDDRACFAVLLQTAQLLKDQELDVNLVILGSVREEVNSAGAIVAAWNLEPDFCVAVDVTHGTTPDGKEKTFPLGKGPVIGVGPSCTRWMSRRLFEKAKALDMEVQTEVMAGSSGTNGWPMQITREGIATTVLSVPLRYMHTPVEVADRRDLKQTAQLLAAFAEKLGEEAEGI